MNWFKKRRKEAVLEETRFDFHLKLYNYTHFCLNGAADDVLKDSINDLGFIGFDYSIFYWSFFKNLSDEINEMDKIDSKETFWFFWKSF